MARNPTSITHGFTLKDPWLTSAILCGDKPIENRSQSFPPGWYAVHTGVAKEHPEKFFEKHVRGACKSDERVAEVHSRLKEAPKGHIAGFCRISHSLPTSLCEVPWAFGPVCMIIAETAWLETPIKCPGQLGNWPLPSYAQCALMHQVNRCTISTHGHELVFRRDDEAYARSRVLAAAEKRARKLEEAVSKNGSTQPKIGDCLGGKPAKAAKVAKGSKA
jgi:hypothetical protein